MRAARWLLPLQSSSRTLNRADPAEIDFPGHRSTQASQGYALRHKELWAGEKRINVRYSYWILSIETPEVLSKALRRQIYQA
jgi:hypothetical protein